MRPCPALLRLSGPSNLLTKRSKKSSGPYCSKKGTVLPLLSNAVFVYPAENEIDGLERLGSSFDGLKR